MSITHSVLSPLESRCLALLASGKALLSSLSRSDVVWSRDIQFFRHTGIDSMKPDLMNQTVLAFYRDHVYSRKDLRIDMDKALDIHSVTVHISMAERYHFLFISGRFICAVKMLSENIFYFGCYKNVWTKIAKPAPAPKVA